MSISNHAQSSNEVAFPFAPFPLIPGSKKPAIPAWQLTPPGMYKAEGDHGLSLMSTALVIDADPRNYPDGRDVLNELWDKHLQQVTTRWVKTPRGGYHIYLRIPAGMKFEKKQDNYPGIDFLSNDGFYVVGAGSKTIATPDGKQVDGVYELIKDAPLADCPTALLSELKEYGTRLETDSTQFSLLAEPEYISICQTAPPAVSGEHGDDATYKLACRGRDLGLPKESVFAAMRDHWNRKCMPPWSDKELWAKVENAYKYARNTAGVNSPEAILRVVPPPPPPDMTSRPEPPPLVTEQAIADVGAVGKRSAIEADSTSDAEYWHDSNRIAYVSIPNNGHWEHYSIQSQTIREWVEQRHWLRTGKFPREQNIKDAIRFAEGKARLEGPEYQAWLRVADHEGKLYVDLCNKDWQAVEVTTEGWRVIDNPPVRFVRDDNMQPLPTPEQAGPEALLLLRRLLNLDGDESWSLFLSFLVACFRPGKPFPICFLSGAKGSAKSTMLRVIRALTDPNACPDRALARKEEDLMIAARHNHVLSFDNVSNISPQMADALCRLSTGGSIGARKLYTDDQERSWRVMRPVVVNGIGTLTGQGDWLDRAIMPRLAPIQEIKTEEDFWQEFEALRPRVLGSLLSAVSGALRRLPDARRLPSKPRMADFYCLAIAAEPDLGVPLGLFSKAYARDREQAAQIVLESSPLAQYIRDYLRLPWSGAASDLLKRINDDFRLRWDQRQKLPGNAGWLSNHLTRIEKELQQVGIKITHDRNSDRRTISIERDFSNWSI